MLSLKTKSVVDTPTEAPRQVVVVMRRPVTRPKIARRTLGFFTFLIIPGFVFASSIPALAVGANPFGDDTPVVLDAPQARAEGQSVEVTSTAATAISRGAFTAETHAQIAARQAARARSGAYSTVGPQQAGDDYPWRASGGGLSPLGYVSRQCVDFAAWRLNRDRGTVGPFSLVWANMTPNGGSAHRWASAWNSNGWQTSNTPIAGSIAWFNGNHVAYVKDVNSDGTVFLEEYNWSGSASYHTRTIAASSVALFLYPPP